tara:strand:- start:2240 stop:2578 length:339 start_codon:yes stop_codon:yes gene_type:complete
MSLTFYGLKSCDSCRAALKALQAAGIDVEVRDVRENGVPEAVLGAALATHGADKLVNRRSTTWRGLDEPSRQMDPVALIGAHPSLMKRPLIMTQDGSSSIGWDAAARAVHGI